MIIKEDTTQIGFIQKPHGVKGELALTLSDGIYAEDLDLEFLLLDIDNGLVPFFVESYRVKGSKSILVKLETVESENKAKELSGCQAHAEITFEEDDEHMPSGAFVGFKVTDATKGDIGEIVEVQEITNNPLFVIKHEGQEILMPINPDFITSVEEAGKKIEVNLPEGLIDLYLEDSSDEEDDFI
ncbi:ribosome maturation factor RimM [Labilibacter marinus]|uniref:ribosome maturation factor RimM n=1 Tax=Labilibacter marinus TaxID=1477105 RepID=UPI0008321ADF|nr:ribosome maturation factor RimM [Labilibacter marinus]